MKRHHRQPLLRTLLLSGLCAGLCGLMAMPSQAARQAEYLDRGVVALPSGSGIYIGWRMLGDDPANIGFNVYRNGTRLNSSPITDSTNYYDAGGTTSAAYTVRPVVNGTELAANRAKATWQNPYWTINLNRPAGGSNASGSYTYEPNDLSVGDLDGDGDYELVVKWYPSNAKDNSQSGYTGNVYLDAYEFNGSQLWRVDLGRNIRAGAHYTQFIVYDLDGDGKAEVAAKTADGTRDGNGTVIGNASADYRNSSGYVLSGPEYLTIFNGQTGAAMATTDYVPARGTVSSWGDNYGNRVDRFLAGVAYLDGSRPSLIMARGYYTRAVVVAWDWRNGSLSRRWTFDSNSSGNGNWAGQGAHSLTVGDVDSDGRDEIVYGAATIDDNGTGLYSTRLGHGDAVHLGDLNPARPGMEIFMVHESSSAYGNHGAEMHDARTGAILWSVPGGGADIGRGVTMDVDPRYAGNESWASVGGLYSATGQQITSSKPSSINFGIWWDADLLREQFNSTMIDKWNYSNNTSSRLLTAYQNGAATNNGTKANPGLLGDIFGDWREELILRNENNTQLLVFSTTAVTSHKLRTLMHDIQYREAIAWQNVGYNQPPHPSFFLGEGMATPPAPSLNFVGTNPNGGAATSSSSSVASSSTASYSSSASSVGDLPGVTLSATAGNGQANLNWTVDGSLDGIEIYRDTDADPAGRVRIASLAANVRNYTATDLSNGTAYWFWVKYRAAGNTYNSNAVSVTPGGTASSSAQSSSVRSSQASSAISSASSSVATTGGNCSYIVTNNWGSGFTGAIRITNTGSSPINGWSVNWNYSGATRITASWNAAVTGSNPYSAGNLSWNASIQPGQSVEFGFQGTQSGSTAEIPVITGSVCQ